MATLALLADSGMAGVEDAVALKERERRLPMFPLFRPLFFARRVRRALLAVPGVEAVRVYREVTTRRVVEVTGNNPEGVADWEYQLATAVEGAMDAVGGFVNHDLEIGLPGARPLRIRWNARKARLRKAEMDALGTPGSRQPRRLTMLEKTTKLTGVPSLARRGFCFDVIRADFDRLTRPGEAMFVGAPHASDFYRDLFQVYPDDLPPECDEDTLYDIEVTVRMTPVGKAEKIEE